MSKLKKVLLMCTAYVLVAALAIGGTIAYLQDTDSDVNVMTLGNVSIAQHEYERALNTDGTYKTITVTKADGSTQESYELTDFKQAKPLYPAVGDPNGGYTSTYARFEQFGAGASGGQAFLAGIKNAQDKLVLVENTGKTDAYVRTIFAFETGSKSYSEWADLIEICRSSSPEPWDYDFTQTIIEVDGNNYTVVEAVYTGYSYGNMRHNGGVLPAGEFTYSSLAEVYLVSAATNDDCEALDGNKNGTYDILVLSQAVQTAGFENAQTALDTAFGKASEKAAEWFGGIEFPVVGTQVSAENITDIDFTAENAKFVFNGTFDAVNISKLGAGSEIYLNNATIGDLTLGSDATITGTGTLNSVNTARNSAETVTLNITDATLDIAGELGVRNTDNYSVLNIENSHVEFGTIFVGEHTNNHGSALAEFNVINSYLSGEENGLGSTINVWGKSGVNAKIYDSEIYTYSRGWHQSEDANDNAITFQGDEFINVDIQRSNMHLYGARSIVFARPYNDHDQNCAINFTIDESLIWVVTKSTHGEETLPVWGATEITDSMLLFTKDRNAENPVFKSFVYGNPVIHGDYHVTTQCGWDADIILADGQTVTFVSDANVSIYDGAGNVQFVKNGSAKVVLEDGAVVKNIGGLN